MIIDNHQTFDYLTLIRLGFLRLWGQGGPVDPPGFFCPQVPQNSFLWSENWYGNSTTIFQVVNTKKFFRSGRFFVTSPFWILILDFSLGPLFYFLFLTPTCLWFRKGKSKLYITKHCCKDCRKPWGYLWFAFWLWYYEHNCRKNKS